MERGVRKQESAMLEADMYGFQPVPVPGLRSPAAA